MSLLSQCLATGSVVVGGDGGVREGYFEVKLTADAEDACIEEMIRNRTGNDRQTTVFACRT